MAFRVVLATDPGPPDTSRALSSWGCKRDDKRNRVRFNKTGSPCLHAFAQMVKPEDSLKVVNVFGLRRMAAVCVFWNVCVLS